MASLPQLTVTPAAQKFMNRMVRFSGVANGGFRLVVSPGGCSGLSSSFSVEGTLQPGDAELPVAAGLKLILPAESRLLLDGVTIDFSDSVLEGGLRFIDPKAASCGCSSSSSASAGAPATASVSISSIKRGSKPPSTVS